MMEPLARLGYASKSLVYAIVGVLAIAAATNQGGRITDTSGALRVVFSQPYGRILLLVLAVGLCGYAVWRILDSVRDPDRHGTGFQGLVTRIGNTIRGVIYGALGIEAFRLFRGTGGSRGDEAEAWVSRIMGVPLGEWLIGLAGLIVIAYGASQVIKAFKGDDDPLVNWGSVSDTVRKICRFGVGARGLIIVTLGVFLVRAAWQHDPGEAAGTRESLIELAGVVEGRWLLALMAAGLLAYAVDQAVHAKYRRIRPLT
jgi:hypothetical protein